jgi:hypothetical protein
MANSTGMDTGQATDHLVQVRRLLRQREYRRAIETIDRRLLNVAALAAPVAVEDLRTYAYERLVQSGPEPSRRSWVNLRRGTPVSLSRTIPVDLRRLARPTLEKVLQWLLREELRAAEEALQADDYATVVAVAELAERIDHRSTRLALVHARALYELAVAALKAETQHLDDVSGKLGRAARLVARAAADPASAGPQEKLSVAIDEVAAIVERRRTRRARVDAVNSVVQRFNRLVQHYEDRDQLVSHVQLGNARASLAQIGADVDRLIQQHPAGSPAGNVLADLRGKCAQYKQYLERLGRSLRAD